MEINKILTADILDIIFEGRNKEYGAYDLRKTYKKRITYALLGTLGVCLLFFVGTLIAKNADKKGAQVLVQDISLENMQKQEEKKPEPLPPPPPPKQEPPKVEMKQFTPPKIVKDNEVKEDEKPPEVKELTDAAIGTKNQEGIKDDGTTQPVFKEETPVAKVEAPKEPEEDYDKLFAVVQIPAEFPGGTEAWKKYLERNLDAQKPASEGAPAGKYTVIVSFIVDKEGNISDVQAENDPRYGTKEEAVRIIKKGPKWKPAVQNGRNVIYRHRQSVTFVVNEE